MKLIENADLKKRILDISYKYKLSHIGSNITAVDIIDEIYSIKEPDEKFVLSSGHAGLALYCVLEKYDTPKHLGDEVYDFKRMLDADEIFEHHGIHPDRCEECQIDCSSGSLGHGLGIAVGMALADRSKNVYCLISDGELAEGSITESIRIIAENELMNLKIYLNYNGWAAYKKTEYVAFCEDDINFNVRETNMNGWPEWLQGQQAHYVVMNEQQYKEVLLILK